MANRSGGHIVKCAAVAFVWSALLSISLPAPAANAPSPDPRVGLRAGWMNAAEASWNVKLVSTTPPSEHFINRASPGDFALINSDLSFVGPYVIQGNFSGVQVWDATDLRRPVLKKDFVCPGSQSDVSVYRKLLFVSGEALNGRTDCGTQGVSDTVITEMQATAYRPVRRVYAPAPVVVPQPEVHPGQSYRIHREGEACRHRSIAC